MYVYFALYTHIAWSVAKQCVSIHCEKLAVILKTQQNNNKQTKYKNNVVRRIAMYVMARHVAMYVVQAVVVVVVFSGDSYKSIAFCSIRGGGRGSGGVILYEKKIATAKERSTRHRRQLSGRFGDIL